MRFLQKRQPGQAWGEVTGKSVTFPIKYQKSTQGGWYANFDTFATNQTNTRVLAQLYPKQLYWSVGASGIQVAVNKGPDGVLNFLATEMKSVADDMTDTFGTGLIKVITVNIALLKSFLIRRIKELLTSISLTIYETKKSRSLCLCGWNY